MFWKSRQRICACECFFTTTYTNKHLRASLTDMWQQQSIVAALSVPSSCDCARIMLRVAANPWRAFQALQAFLLSPSPTAYKRKPRLKFPHIETKPKNLGRSVGQNRESNNSHHIYLRWMADVMSCEPVISPAKVGTNCT